MEIGGKHSCIPVHMFQACCTEKDKQSMQEQQNRSNKAKRVCFLVNCNGLLCHISHQIVLHAGRWIEGAHARKCINESVLLFFLAVMLPTAVSAYWESEFRAQLIQRDDAQQQLNSGRGTMEQKIGPCWSYLIGQRSPIG